MEFPANLKFSKEHTWISVEGNIGTIGITEFAQSELGEIVYVDLPNVGSSYKRDEVFGTVEAVKTTSDLFIPLSGNITEVNTSVINNPSLVNDDPFGKGWLIKIKLSNISESDSLLDSVAYSNLIS